jgi:hypothetical protein
VAVLLVGACAGGALADVGASSAATVATVGGSVTLSAQGVDAGPYTLSMTEPAPTQGVTCGTKLSGPTRASRGNIRLTGKVPTSLPCYGADGSVLTHDKLTGGTYTLILCQSSGPVACNGAHTEIQHQISVRAAPKPKPPTHH